MRKAFICPTKYVQGEDELLNLGYFVRTFGKKALLIADPFALNLVKEKLEATQAKFGVEFIPSGDLFKGRQQSDHLPHHRGDGRSHIALRSSLHGRPSL